MADKKARGLFLVWADVPADMEDDFNRWYNEEHMAELLAIPGVLSAARYEIVHSDDPTAGSGSPKYLSAYELANPEVRDTPEYGEHLLRPTEWSQRVNLGERATRVIQNNYRLIHPADVSPELAQRDMAPVLQVGRMSIPEDQEAQWNEFYNNVYGANYAQVPGCIGFRRYELYKGHGPKYGVVYEFEHEKVSQTEEWFAARAKSGGGLGDQYPRMTHDEGSPGVYKKIFQL